MNPVRQLGQWIARKAIEAMQARQERAEAKREQAAAREKQVAEFSATIRNAAPPEHAEKIMSFVKAHKPTSLKELAAAIHKETTALAGAIQLVHPAESPVQPSKKFYEELRLLDEILSVVEELREKESKQSELKSGGGSVL